MANQFIKINDFSSFWNPYHSFQKLENDDIFTNIKNMLSPFVNSNIIYILGPMNQNLEQYIYKFTINLNENDDIFFQMIQEQENEFAPLTIRNYPENQIKSCELLNINKNDKNSEKDLIEWTKIIEIVLGFTRIYLQDNSYMICPKLKYHDFPIQALSIIKKKVGYYASFNFYPYKQTNSGLVNKSETIEKKINNLFQTITWSDFDLFFIKINDSYNSDNINFQSIQEKYNYLKNKFKQFSSSFYTFKYFNTEDCNLFINLLDLFDKTYNNIPIKIPGIKLLNEINNILLECKWIWENNNLHLKQNKNNNNSSKKNTPSLK
jgi:hypothetical protein